MAENDGSGFASGGRFVASFESARLANRETGGRSMDRDADPAGSAQGIGPESGTPSQRIARVVLATALVLLGLWIVHRFLPALAWATILAIALWPVYRRVMPASSRGGPRVLAPFVLTALVGLILIVPLVYAAVEVARESGNFLQYIDAVRHSGLAMPVWLPRLPGVGSQFAGWWQANLSNPQNMHALLGRIATHIPTNSASRLGGEVFHRLIIFGFTLLTLFFLFRDGAGLSRRLLGLSHRVLGPSGERVARHVISAVHGTVTGLVLVGLAEGVLLGFAYALAGLPHAVSIAALTGILAVIPFGAPLAFCAAGLYLVSGGSTAAAAAVVGFGFLVVFVADHLVRPVLIGGAARLPFLWVLLGIIGGLETFGLLGLFLGPMVMAALISLWREWTQPPAPPSAFDAARPPSRL